MKLGTARWLESVGAGPPYGNRYPGAREWTRGGALKTTPVTTARESASKPASLLQMGHRRSFPSAAKDK